MGSFLSRFGSQKPLAASGFVAVLATFAGSSLFAQVRQYTPPGGLGEELEGRKDRLEKAVEDARWHLGGLRLDPALWISDVSYVDSPAVGADSDLTARAGAGLRAYLPVGSKTTFAAYALPEYIWWQEREDERRVNQRFGVGSFTYFNRLSIELTAERNEDFDYVTGELLQRVTARQDRLELELEVPIFHTISISASGFRHEFESLAEDGDLDLVFSNLDREDTGYRAGIRYRPTEEVYVGGGAGHAESDFAADAADRSNSGDFWYAELGWQRPKLLAAFVYEQNDLSGDEESSFVAYTGDTYSAHIEWRPRDTFAPRLYGSRALGYSALPGLGTAFVDETYGVGLRMKLGWRLELDVFTETGSLEYDEELGGTGTKDDIERSGAFLTIDLGRNFELGVGYRQSRIDRSGPFPDQKIDEIRGSLRFGLGAGSGTWY
ncbi:MAG: hypothetical protein R2862_02855 [Thermoanaerobaculia bacterium]